MGFVTKAGKIPSGRGLGLSDVAAEGILLLGGARAILLQLANPAVGRGVARHSDFSSDPMRRLRSTLSYVYVVMFGSEAQMQRAASKVDAAHRPVHGDGYAASDPALQLWVAATLYESAVTVWERIFGPLDVASAEGIYRDYAVLGTALQVPQHAWPADRAAFERYWLGQSQEFCVTEETLAVARDLLHPARAPLWLRLAMPTMRLITAGLLSDELRTLYGLPWGAARERRFRRTLATISRIYRLLPRRIRHWPRDHYLAGAAPSA